MAPSNRKKDCEFVDGAQLGIVPTGTPDWITAELVEKTIQVWQPYYKSPLSTDDAIEIIRNAGLLFDAFSSRRSSTENSGQPQAKLSAADSP